MFWWYLKSPQHVSSAKPWPTILWLQGGLVYMIVSFSLCGNKAFNRLTTMLFQVGSGVGRGNFLEIGPL